MHHAWSFGAVTPFSDQGFTKPPEGFYFGRIKEVEDMKDGDNPTPVAFRPTIEIDPRIVIDPQATQASSRYGYGDAGAGAAMKLFIEVLGIPEASLKAQGFAGDPAAALKGKTIFFYYKPDAKDGVNQKTGKPTKYDDFRVMSAGGWAQAYTEWYTKTTVEQKGAIVKGNPSYNPNEAIMFARTAEQQAKAATVGFQANPGGGQVGGFAQQGGGFAQQGGGGQPQGGGGGFQTNGAGAAPTPGAPGGWTPPLFPG